MAKITRDEIAEKDIFINIVKSAKDAKEELVVLESTLSLIKDTAKALKKDNAGEIPTNNDELKKQNQFIKESNALALQKLKIDKETEDVRKKVSQTEQQITKALIEAERQKQAIIKTQEAEAKQNKRIQQEREKQIKKQLALEKKELDAYQKKSKRLNLLRKRYKSLLLTEGKTSKETKKLGKEVQKLDKELKDVDAAAGQFQRKVGNYPDTLGNAAKSILGVAAAAGAAAGSFSSVQGSLENTAEGSENVREVTSALGGIWDQVSNVVAGAALDVVDYGKAVYESVDAGEGLIDALTTQEDQFNRTSEATENFTDKVSKSIDGQVALTNRVIAFEKAVRPLELSVARLNGEIEEQGVIAGDSTRSFEELENAVLKSQLLQIERSKINISIAKEELGIVQEEIKLKNDAGGAGVDLLNKETEALIKLKEARSDLKIETLENEKELRQIQQDRLERDLDILIDGFDNQKTINERIIADERQTLQKRSDLLLKTNELANQSFREQKEVLAELSNAGIDIDELLTLDATQLQKQIRALEQSEIIEGRTLEVVRERRIVLQDLEDAQNDLNDAKNEGLSLETDILAQEKAIKDFLIGSEEEKNKALEQLELEREQNEIDLLKKRLENAKEGSIEFLTIQQELNDAILNQLERRNEEEKELEEKSTQNLRDEYDKKNAIISASSDKIVESIDERISKTQDEINAAQKQSDFFKQLAAEGNIEAKQSLAEQNAIIAEAEAKKQKIERRKQAVELVSSTIQSFNNELGEGKSTQEALKEALTGTATITALIASLPTFLEGTENTGTHGQGIDGKGGFHAVLHPNERVLTKEQNSMIGGYSNSQVAEIMQNHRLGNFNLIETTNNQQDFSILEGKMDAIEKAIINKPETNIELGQITSTSMMIAQTKKRGKNITTNRFKVN